MPLSQQQKQHLQQLRLNVGTRCPSNLSPGQRASFFSVPIEYFPSNLGFRGADICPNTDEYYELPSQLKSLCGLEKHFSNMKAKKHPSGSINYRLNMDLSFFNGTDNRKKPLVDKLSHLRDFVNNTYQEELINLCSCKSTDTLTDKAIHLCLGSPPGLDYGDWVEYDFNPPHEHKPLSFPLRVMMPEGWTVETVCDTVDISTNPKTRYSEHFHLPTGAQTKQSLRESNDGLTHVYNDKVTDRGPFITYLKAINKNQFPSDLLTVEFFPGNNNLRSTLVGKVFSTNDITNNDIVITINIMWMEHVSPAHKALWELIKSKKNDMEGFTFKEQMKECMHWVESVRRGGGRILRSVEDGYEDVGDIFAAKVYMPLLCELLLSVPIKAGNVGNVRPPPAAELQSTVTTNSKVHRGLNPNATIAFAAVGFSLFADDKSDQALDMTVFESKKKVVEGAYSTKEGEIPKKRNNRLII